MVGVTVCSLIRKNSEDGEYNRESAGSKGRGKETAKWILDVSGG